MDNGALLTKNSHAKLHKIEKSHHELYTEYQYWFRIINDMKCPPTKEIKKIMRHLKLRFITAIQVNEIIKEEMDYYDEYLRKQICMIRHEKKLKRKK